MTPEGRNNLILDRPNIYSAEDGNMISIELPHLSIQIKTR